MNIKNILLPFDGSEHSVHALDYAATMARLTDASITLLTCYDVLPMLDDMAISHIDEVQRQYAAGATKVLVAGRSRLEESGVTFQTMP